MKRREKEKEQSLKIGNENIKDREQKEEFKIELVKIGKLNENTSQNNYEDEMDGVSDRSIKENFADIDRNRVLESLLSLTVESWNYKNQSPDIRHIGPMAQDFASAFGVGEDDRRINMVDAFGVTLASIQALNEKIEQRDVKIRELEKKLNDLKGSVS
jgi:hypothetical protein